MPLLTIGSYPGGFNINSDGSINPRTLVDKNGSCGTVNQALVSTGLGDFEWCTLGGSGTVTSITAGTGLTGGTITGSGTIAIDSTCVLEPADFTASGQLLAGTGTGTYTALAVGSNAQVLTADSACTGGVKWAAAGGGGGTLATPIACGVVYGCSNGSDNVSLGFGAIRNMCGTSVRNVAMGNNAMSCLTTNHCCNIAIGTNAMFGSFASTNFRCNVAIGNASMANVTGTNIGNNVYVGADTAAFGTGSNNVAVGFCSQRSNCGSGNTSVGACSLSNNTGISNVAVGLCAGWALSSTACCNIMIGAGAGACPSLGALTGSGNVIIGIDKGLPVSAGNNQLVLGGWLTGCSTLAIKPAAGVMDCVNSTGTAGQVLMSNGSNAICWGAASAAAATPTVAGGVLGCTVATNTAIGCNALLSNTTGCCNTAIGTNALCLNLCGYCNTAIGVSALQHNVGGYINTAIGDRSLYCNVSGFFNVAVGHFAAYNNTTGCCNTAVGSLSLNENTTGINNVALGLAALVSNTTGNGNIAIGCFALCGNTTGCGNLMVGGLSSAGTYCPVFTTTTENNRVMIGSCVTTNAYVKVAWTVTSDARDKTNVTALSVGLDFVNQLNPVSFQFKESRDSDVAHGPVRYGFLAQEVLAVEGENPVVIDDETPETLRMVNDHLNAVFAKAIKELSAKNDALEARLALLENA